MNRLALRGLLATAPFTTVVLLAVPVNLAAQTQPSAEQATSGWIKVNGKSVPPGFALAKDSTIESGPKSSAVVSLGKLGRVEVFPSSKMKITFDETQFNVVLSAGGARIYKAEGATVSVTTKDGEVSTTAPVAGSYTVDTECGDTFVTAHDLSVVLRIKEETRTLSPGARSKAGVARPDCKPTRRAARP